MEDLKKIITSNTARKTQAELLLNAFNDEQPQAIQKELERLFQGKECLHRLKAVCINITHKITNRLASVYVKDAVRSIQGTEQDKASFDDFQIKSALGVRLKQANKISKLTGNALIRVLYRNGQPCIDLLSPNYYDVLTGSSPDDIKGVLISDHQAETYTYWTNEEVIKLDKNMSEVSREDNPYKVLPFVHIFSQAPLDSYFQYGLNSLLSVQQAINLRISDLCYMLNFQSYSTAILTSTKQKGGVANSQLEVGPASFLQIPQGSKFEFISPNAPIEDTIQAIDFIIKQCAVSYGLPADSMSLEPTAESGLSKIVSSAELTESRQDQIAIFSKVEQDIFNLWRIIHNHHTPHNTISDKATLTVNFADLQPTTSPLDKVKEWSAMLELGLMSQVDILQAKDPDLTREQAQAKLLQVKDDLQEFNKITSF